MKYRLGTDGESSWTIERSEDRKVNGIPTTVWVAQSYFNSLEMAAMELMERRARVHVCDMGLIEAIKISTKEVISAVEALGMGPAKAKIKKAVEEKTNDQG